jgi:hypothetical protein
VIPGSLASGQEFQDLLGRVNWMQINKSQGNTYIWKVREEKKPLGKPKNSTEEVGDKEGKWNS